MIRQCRVRVVVVIKRLAVGNLVATEASSRCSLVAAVSMFCPLHHHEGILQHSSYAVKGKLAQILPFSAYNSPVRLELNGQDITVIARNVRTEEEIGQRRTAEFDLTYEDGVVFDQSSADDFLLANSAPFLLADGGHFKLASGGGDPENYMPVVISHPDRTFRDVALSIQPWLYWPLDEGRGLATADDITLPERTQEDPSAANRDGTWSTTPGAVILRRLEAERAAVPYGAAPRFEAGAAPGITGPATSGLGIEVAVSLFVRIDVGATGSSSVLTARSGGNGMDIVRERVNARHLQRDNLARWRAMYRPRLSSRRAGGSGWCV